MHCNHFIKLHDFKSVNVESLLLLMTRSAGVMCANSQASIDATNIFLLSGTKFHTTNAGTIVYQMKNNEDYTHKPKPKLFASMNPYDLNILEPEDDAILLIQIIFALAAKIPSLHVTRHPPMTYGAIIYDIWSAGLSSKFLSPITPNNNDIWKALLQASYGWKG